MEAVLNLKYLGAALIYSAVGMLMFALGFLVFDRITPGSFWKEILDEHNTALAIVVGSVALGLSIIIASAIHG